MKIIKKILKFLINSIIIILICSLLLSITGKKVFYDLLYSNVFKPVMVEETTKLTDTKIDKEKIDKIFNNEETEELVNEFIERTMNDLSSDKESNVNIADEFLKYIKNNRATFEKELGITITDEQLEQIKESPEYKELANSYTKSIKQSKSKMTPKERKVVKVYNQLISNNFKVIVISIIVFLTVLIALLNNDLYSWLKDSSINLITSGIMVLLTSLIVQVIVNTTIKDLNIKFSTKPLTNSSLITIGVGIVTLIIYLIINKIVKKPKLKENYVINN